MTGRLPARQRVRRTLLVALLLLFPLAFNYWSPVLPVMGALEGVACFSLLFWGAWTVSSIFLGRAACGWFCPLAGLQEVVHDALQRPIERSRAVAWLRWALWGSWITILGWALHRGGGLARMDLLYRTEHVVSWDGPRGAAIYTGMFGLVLLAAIPLGGRGFCSHLCWWGPLNALGGRVGRLLRLPQLELTADPARCSSCRRCDRACPAGVSVSSMVQLGARPPGDCVLCGSCADACPTGAAKLVFGRAAQSPCADRSRKASA